MAAFGRVMGRHNVTLMGLIEEDQDQEDEEVCLGPCPPSSSSFILHPFPSSFPSLFRGRDGVKPEPGMQIKHRPSFALEEVEFPA